MAKVDVEKPIPLVLREDDVDASVRAAAQSARKKRKILASEDAAAFFDALPNAIARRLKAVVPKGFELAELEMTFSVKGELFGTGIGGDVKAKFAPLASGGTRQT